MKWSRASGILVHPTSLPGPYGIGDLGPSAITLLDTLVASRQKLWQVLPLGPTGYGNSPYALLSAFAGNSVLISPDLLVEDGLLSAEAIAAHPGFPADHVDYGAAVPWKMTLLWAAHDRFTQDGPHREAYHHFCEENAHWLDDYALYAAIKAQHSGAAWVQWEEPLARREPEALALAAKQLSADISFQKFLQYLFFRQWGAVRAAAHERGITIIGDLAIFVAHDSADVWAHPDLFQLDEHGNPLVVAGVPPDYFSETGQRWGNPLYRWDRLRADHYAWWVARVRQALTMMDMIRLDHFRGFHAYWEIPGDEDTAVNGHWVPGPDGELFDAIREALGDVPFIAEDLGQITAGVRALRRQLGFPGMKVLQFAFSEDARNIHLPHNFRRDTIVYTGTHDNDTTRGWFETREKHERAYVLEYLRSTPDEVVWEMIRAAMASVATLCVIPMQDVLNLGTEARMNFPSRASGNWEWRYTTGQITPEIQTRLASYATIYGRWSVAGHETGESDHD